MLRRERTAAKGEHLFMQQIQENLSAFRIGDWVFSAVYPCAFARKEDDEDDYLA